MNFFISLYDEASAFQTFIFWMFVLTSIFSGVYLVALYNLRTSWGKLDGLREAIAFGTVMYKDADIKAIILHPSLVLAQVLMYAVYFLVMMYVHWYLVLWFTSVLYFALITLGVLGVCKYSKKELQDIAHYHPTNHDDDAACNAM